MSMSNVSQSSRRGTANKAFMISGGSFLHMIIIISLLTNDQLINCHAQQQQQQHPLKQPMQTSNHHHGEIEWIQYDKLSGIDHYYANIKPGSALESLSRDSQSTGAGAAGPLASALGLGPAIAGTPSVSQHRRLAKQAPSGEASSGESTPTGTPISTITTSDSSSLQQAASSNAVCMSESCVKAAAQILRNMDSKVDPCQDFYRYSCGGWIDSQVIPEDKTSVSLFTTVQDELDNKLRQLIEKKEPSPTDPPIVTKMRQLYESCMNTCEYFINYL